MKKMMPIVVILFFTSKISSQNVGIGITTPVTRLHVVGPNANIATFSGGGGMWITLAEGSTNRGYIGSFAGNPEDVDFGTYNDNLTGRVHLTTGNIPRLTVTPGGNVGIGEQNPIAPLNFASALGNKISLWGISTNHYGFGIQPSLLQIYTPSVGEDIAFGTGNSGSFNENVRFKGNGNVGIGTGSPSQVLEVNGAIKVSDANASPGAGTIRYNPATKDFEGFDGTRWKSLTANDNSPAPKDFPNTDANSHASDNMGYAVKMWEDYVFVGAPNYDVGANANQGAVKIYHKNKLTNQYESFQTITASDGVAGDKFGYSLDATSSTNQCFDVSSIPFDDIYLVVGAPNKNSNRGSIYLFRYDYNTDQFITVANNFSSSDGTANDNYWYAVSILPQGFYNIPQVLVGAPLKTVNGNAAQGRAYIVNITGNFTSPCTSSILTGLSEAYVLNMKTNAANSYFGSAVAAGLKTKNVNSTNAIYAVGASFRTVNGNTNQGVVYMFNYGSTLNGDPYDSIAIASDGNALDYFGNAISIENDGSGLLAIAANYKESGANASQGVVYLYKDTSNPAGKRWYAQKNKFTAPDGNAGDHFGSSLAWDDKILMIGSSNRDDGVVDAGAVYVYERIPYQEAGMRFKKKIADLTPQAGAMVGKSISQNSTKYVIGVPDWDAPGKTDAGKIIIGDIFY